MSRHLRLFAGLLIANLPAPAMAGAQLELGVLSGISFPFGQAVGGESIKDTTPPMVPIELDAGLRFSPMLFVGIFGRLGLATSSSPHEPDCYLCVGHVIMLGVEARFHLAPAASVDPWLGLGLGLELPGDIIKSGARPDEPLLRRTSGPMLELEAGLDFPFGDHVAVGPWLGLATGVYTERSVTLEEQRGTGYDPYSAAVHVWVSVGVRVGVRF